MPGASGSEGALLTLTIAVGILFTGTVVLSGYALLMRLAHRRRERESRRLTERWRDPVLRAVAEPETVPEVQELVRDEDAVHFLSFVIEYARRVRGEERRALRQLAAPFLSRMVERARTGRTEVRAWAVQTLGTLGLPEHADVVIEALDDPSPLVAMVAARSLAREETPQYAPEVLARLDRFATWNRFFLASMLASMGPEVSGSLRTALADESGSPATRAILAEALRLEGDFLAADVAAAIVEKTRDQDLLVSALRLLAAVGRPEHADVVRPLCEAENSVIRAQALHALGSVGDHDDVPILVEAMEDSEPWPALYAARGARNAGGRAWLERLIAEGDPAASLARQVLTEESSA